MGEPSNGKLDDEWVEFGELVAPAIARVTDGLTRRDASAALQFASAVAAHLEAGGLRDLATVNRLATSESRFERGRIAFGRSVPGDPFDEVEKLGLVVACRRSYDTESTILGLARKMWREFQSIRRVDKATSRARRRG